MGRSFETTIEDMHRLAERIGELLSSPAGCDVEPFRLRLVRAHALALADELALLDDGDRARGARVAPGLGVAP